MSSGTSISSDRTSPSQYCNGSVSRKRPAAVGLLKISLDDQCMSALQTISSSPISSRTENFLGPSTNAKRQRESNIDPCVDNCITDAIDGTFRSPHGSSDREDSSKHGFRNFNNCIVGGYQLVGAGKTFTAYHIEKKVVKTCTIIDQKKFQKLLALKHRLLEADKHWKYDDPDEMSEFLLPKEVEVLTDDCGQMFMFSPWHYGSLQDKVRGNKLAEFEVRRFFVQILRCVAFCHSIGVIMRDFKMRKFVFTHANMSCLRLRDIFDLHICEDISDDRLSSRRSCPAYVAPEVLLKEINTYAGRSADIWALGVLLYAMLFGCCPFTGSSLENLFSRILKVQFIIPPGFAVSNSVRIVIVGILRKEPHERPTADELLHLPWVMKEPEEFKDTILSTPFSQPISIVTQDGSFTLKLGSLTCIDDILNNPSILQYFEVEDDDHVVPSPQSSSESSLKPLLNKRLHSISLTSLLGVSKVSQNTQESRSIYFRY